MAPSIGKQHLIDADEMDFENFTEIVRLAFTHQSSTKELSFLNEKELKAIIGMANWDEKFKARSVDEECCSPFLRGYPDEPYYEKLSDSLWKWVKFGDCPMLLNKTFYGFDEEANMNNRIAMWLNVHPLVTGMKTLWSHWCQQERIFRLRKIIKGLGRRGLLDLLGMRRTVGTYDEFPPRYSALAKSFNDAHNVNSTLSVGARALSKHFHRDQTNSWWGHCSGSDREKNTHAQTVMKKILDDAKWINIHMLAPDMILVIEIRQTDGYGARWTSDGNSFRGFLEPMVEGGHESGWRH